MDWIEVHKFGDTSVADAGRIRCAAEIIAEATGRAAVCVVSSAMARVADRLLEATRTASEGGGTAALGVVSAIRDEHAEIAQQLCGDRQDELQELSSEVDALTAEAGERLLVRALLDVGCDAIALDADGFLETNDAFGDADPLSYVADRRTRAVLLLVLQQGQVAVVTGYCGRGPDGATTTLGRGGSDFTATLAAAALGAQEVTLWTDVAGVFSADPRIVPEAMPIPQLHYREAAELSYYGAEVLHSRAMIPISAMGIPVYVRSSFDPEAPGTLFKDRFSRGNHPVKAVTAVRDQSLVSVEGKGMSGVPGIAARGFSCLAQHDISVTMISQSTSEASICLALPAGQAIAAEIELKRELRSDVAVSLVEDIVVRPHVGLVAAVGLGMARTPGVAAGVLNALGSQQISVLAIAQGSSELNISLAVDSEKVDETIAAIHRDVVMNDGATVAGGAS